MNYILFALCVLPPVGYAAAFAVHQVRKKEKGTLGICALTAFVIGLATWTLLIQR